MKQAAKGIQEKAKDILNDPLGFLAGCYDPEKVHITPEELECEGVCKFSMVATSMSIANGNLLHLQLREMKQHFQKEDLSKFLPNPLKAFLEDSDPAMSELAEIVQGNKVRLKGRGTIIPESARWALK